MGKTVVDYSADGAIDDATVGAKDGSGRGARQSARSTRQEQAVSVAGCVVALGPRQHLDVDTAVRAVHTVHAVPQPHREAPQGDEREPAWHAGRVVGWPAPVTAGANRLRLLARHHGRVDHNAIVAKVGRAVDKAFEPMTSAPERF
jgi:hypothetical protein